MRLPAENLDYLDLLKEARVDLPASELVPVRVAILADFATQQLALVLRVLFARRGLRLELYDPGYDVIDSEIVHPGSGLYAFEPRFVLLLPCAEKLKARIYARRDRKSFAQEAADRFVSLWQTLKSRSQAIVVQGTFVIPSERAFGNFELKVDDSVGSIVQEVNHRLVAAARDANNVLLCDVDHLAAEVGRSKWFDERLWAMAKAPCALEHLPMLAQSIVDIVLAATGSFIKCVVVDLDNTLWGGVIGDDGLSGIVLGDFDEGEAYVAFQRFLAELKRRGIIIAVVSKNEEANAILPFREHPHMVLKESDISVFVVNWDNKAQNIKVVQKILNIGFDSMVFLDDNPFERGLVREYLPAVHIPDLPEDPSGFLTTLASSNLFEVASYSAADRQRPEQYREEAQRELAKQSFTDVDDYLRSLDMSITVERFAQKDLARIAQLTQRSNQFNLTTPRLGEADCESLMRDERSWLPLSVKLKDRFGDYGLISVVILKLLPSVVEIDAYLMSCRVLRRGVESFVMNVIFDEARRRGSSRVTGRYVRTAKNEMVRNFFDEFGFTKSAEDGQGNADWTMRVSDYVPRKALMTPGEGSLG